MNWWQKLKKLFRRKPKNPDEWELQDFVAELDEVMQQQAKESPEIRELHEKLARENKKEDFS